jgi:hypothetical protein
MKILIKRLNIIIDYKLNVFHMLGIMLFLMAIALVMPFFFIYQYQLVKKWERE